ncbi:hypothetical protein NE579_16795, partial [Intestinimonas massiliensis]
AKGLDFENVTLVGVIAADLALYVDSFRAGERTFSLLTQVVSRCFPVHSRSSPGRRTPVSGRSPACGRSTASG